MTQQIDTEHQASIDARNAEWVDAKTDDEIKDMLTDAWLEFVLKCHAMRSRVFVTITRGTPDTPVVPVVLGEIGFHAKVKKPDA